MRFCLFPYCRIAEGGGGDSVPGGNSSEDVVNPHPKNSPKKRGMLSKRTLVEGTSATKAAAASGAVKTSLAMDYTTMPDGTLEISWEDW